MSTPTVHQIQTGPANGFRVLIFDPAGEGLPTKLAANVFNALDHMGAKAMLDGDLVYVCGDTADLALEELAKWRPTVKSLLFSARYGANPQTWLKNRVEVNTINHPQQWSEEPKHFILLCHQHKAGLEYLHTMNLVSDDAFKKLKERTRIVSCTDDIRGLEPEDHEIVIHPLFHISNNATAIVEYLKNRSKARFRYPGPDARVYDERTLEAIPVSAIIPISNLFLVHTSELDIPVHSRILLEDAADQHEYKCLRTWAIAGSQALYMPIFHERNEKEKLPEDTLNLDVELQS